MYIINEVSDYNLRVITENGFALVLKDVVNDFNVKIYGYNSENNTIEDKAIIPTEELYPLVKGGNINAFSNLLCSAKVGSRLIVKCYTKRNVVMHKVTVYKLNEELIWQDNGGVCYLPSELFNELQTQVFDEIELEYLLK